MNRVLVTGLSLVGSGDETICKACNYDFSWLIHYPSVLLWIDKIIITPAIRETIHSSAYPSERPALAKSIKLIFETIEDQGLLEVRNPKEVLSPKLQEELSKQPARDRLLLRREFPNNVRIGRRKRVPGQIFIDGSEYCSVHVESIYTSLVLARAWQAGCLFNPSTFNYCKFRFAVSGLPREGMQEKVVTFHQILQAYLPEPSLFPYFVFGEKCETCAKEEMCQDTFLPELQQNLQRFLKWRDYDELHQLRDVLTNIAKHREQSEKILDPGDIISDFRAVEAKLFKRLHSLFPKIRRWTNLTTTLSIPIAVAGVSTGLGPLVIGGAALAGASQMAREVINRLSNKYRWVGFLNKRVELR